LYAIIIPGAHQNWLLVGDEYEAESAAPHYGCATSPYANLHVHFPDVLEGKLSSMDGEGLSAAEGRHRKDKREYGARGREMLYVKKWSWMNPGRPCGYELPDGMTMI